MTLHPPPITTPARPAPRWLAVAAAIALSLVLGWTWQAGRPDTVAAAPGRQGPFQPPSALDGRAIYRESCAPCHGMSGGGDGPTASQLPDGATVLADPAIARAASPDAWFDVVKNGRMDRLMPPWKNQLTDEQIWDVVEYASTLSTSESEIMRGQAVWDQECAACHGQDGAGDGPQAVANNLQVPDMGDLAASAAVSLDSWYAVTAAGRDAMPAFADTLAEAEIWAALSYARTFSYEPLAAQALPTGTGRLAGAVVNGTPGGSTPAGLTVTLNTFEDFNPLQTQETQTAPDGSFEFAGLPTDQKYVYLLSTEYQGTGFGSDVASFAESQAELDLSVTVYEPSDQPGEIGVDLAQWFLQSHQGGILVGELYRISHAGDHVYTGGDELAPGKRAVLSFNLPPDATSLVLDGGEIGDRFIRTADGVVDTLPLAPGGRQILMRYLLPYSGTKAELVHSVPYPVSALNVLVADGPKVETELEAKGQQTVNEEQWNSYAASNLAAGQEISLELSELERASASSGVATGAPSSSAIVLSYYPLLLAGVAGLALAVAGLILAAYLLRKPPEAPQTPARVTPSEPKSAEELAADRQRLLEGIAQLDDAYAAGELDQERYESARSAQKRNLLLISRQLTLVQDTAPASDAARDAVEQGAV